MTYLELQVTNLRNRGKECLLQGGDQAIHNYVLRYSLLSEYGISETLIPNMAGWVLSMTLIPHRISAEEELNFRNTHKVIHQWKWWKNLREFYEDKYKYAIWLE